MNITSRRKNKSVTQMTKSQNTKIKKKINKFLLKSFIKINRRKNDLKR